MSKVNGHDVNDTETQQQKITRLTNAVMEQLKGCSLQDALTVIGGTGGHLIARISNGQLAMCKQNSENLGKHMATAAYALLAHEANLKKQADGEAQNKDGK